MRILHPRSPDDRDSLLAASFDAGGALAMLGARMTDGMPGAAAWLDRLALRAAAAGLARSGRREDGAMIRDAMLLTRPGDDPGPAGRAFAVWRRLTSRTPAMVDADTLRHDLAPWLGRSGNDGLAEALAAEDRPAPLASARAATILHRHFPREPAVALAVADMVLAHHQRWPRMVPLLAAGLPRGALPLAPDWPVSCLEAYTSAARQALSLSLDLAPRAAAVLAIRPKLRAKSADPVLDALVSEDALSATLIHQRIAPAMSDRAARRLLERLETLGVIRELTGRATHRLYGL